MDVRIGGLVTVPAIIKAIDLAAGYTEEGDDGRSTGERLIPFVVMKSPIMGETAFPDVEGLFAGAWSCAIDTALNQREAWAGARDAHGNVVWASDKYVPQEHLDSIRLLFENAKIKTVH